MGKALSTVPFLLIALNGSDMETLNKLQFANGLFRDGMYEMARKQFLEISGSSYPDIGGEAAFMQAECLFQMKNYPLAHGEFEKALSSSFTREVKKKALSRMADSAYRMGRFSEAAGLYSRFIGKHGENEEALFYLAQSFSELKKYDESVKYYKKLLETYPVSLYRDYAMYSAGYACFKTGQYNRAAAFFAGVSDGKIKAESLFYEGLSCIESSNVTAALARFDTIIKTFPAGIWASKAALKKAEIFIREKKFEEAEKNLGTLRKNAGAPAAAQAFYLTGQMYYAKKSFAQAGVYYRNCADNYPKTEWAEKSLFSTGWCYVHLKDYRRGRKAFAELILKHSKTAYFPKAQFLIGHCYFFDGDYGHAAEAYGRVVSAFPGDALAGEALYWQGVSLLKAGRFEESVPVFREVIKRGEEKFLPRAYLGLGKSLSLSGDFGGAANALEKGFSVKGSPAEKDKLAFELGNVCVKLGRFSDAVSSYGKIVSPSLMPGALTASGHAYLNWKKFEKARQCYQKTMALYPSSPAAEDAAFSVGLSFYKEKKWAEAHAHLMDFAAKYSASPRIADAYLYAGWSAFSLKDWQGAVKFWKKHYEINPTEDVLLRIGDAYYNAGLVGEAKASYEELQRKFPASPKMPQALYSMALLEKKEGNLDGASEYIKRLDREHPSSSIAADALFTLAEIYDEKGDYASSGVIYGRIYAEYPKSKLAVDSLYRAGRSAARAKNYVLARKLYGELLKKNSSYGDEVRFRICEAYFNEKDYASAAEEFLKFRSDFPSSGFASAALEMARRAMSEQGLSVRAEE
ncbi:MAG: tetratricopeptide repeat protein, partial [Elusimicrobia bacterium]|nr:tetratricopeptide repeat protein [Elusimicrobiota bacterium]